jgi:hypothetical protein
LFAVRRLVPIETLRESNGVVGDYLQTVGTIYAVLLAFVVYVVWQQFNSIQTYVEQEANETQDLFRTAKGFPEPARTELRRQLKRYVDGVIDEEWKDMVGRAVVGFDRVWALFDELSDSLQRCAPEGDKDRPLFVEMLVRLNDLSDARTSRLSAARFRVPMALKALLYTGAVVIVGSMYLFAVESLAVHALLTGALAGAVSHVLFVIADLDDAFRGDWKVSRAPFENVHAFMERCLLEETERQVP